ncbi:MAG: hypothetical protein AVDCRST_MAG11-2167, partial [uncultured Gemmatimonadaceae bacterium]
MSGRGGDDRVEHALEHAERVLLDVSHRVVHSLEELLRVPEPAASRWHRAGIAPRTERLFNAASAALLLVLAAGWSWSIVEAGRDGAPASAPPV